MIDDSRANKDSAAIPPPLPVGVSIALRVMMGMFGLPFLTAGALLISFGVWALFTNEARLVGLFMAVFGLPFFGVGLVLLSIAVLGEEGWGLKKFLARTGLGARRRSVHSARPQRRGPGAMSQYQRCPSCDSVITDKDLISPSGDVRCDHCSTWFNARA